MTPSRALSRSPCFASKKKTNVLYYTGTLANLYSLYLTADPATSSYELQVEEAMRGLGIGRSLLTQLESIGLAYGLDKIMLTVLKGTFLNTSRFLTN